MGTSTTDEIKSKFHDLKGKVKENEKEKDREKDKEKEDGKTFIGPLKVSKSMREIRTKFSPKLQLRKLL